MRVFAISDVHIDYQINMDFMLELSSQDFLDDALLIAGDVTSNIGRLETLLTSLCKKFAFVFFVPGNHELWVQKKGNQNSIQKFWDIKSLCDRLGVNTSPLKIGDSSNSTWIVPLLSWYITPEEGDGSLYLPKEGEDETNSMWADNVFCKWPEFKNHKSAAEYFLHFNRDLIEKRYDAPVISFSHFLPRIELIFSDMRDVNTILNRQKILPSTNDPNPRFNFSRVAGCTELDKQIRAINAKIHVYGHQHRNRYRNIDGVTYISHCLGYANEREKLHSFNAGLKGIWENGNPIHQILR